MVCAAARPMIRPIAVLLYALCVTVGPGLHLWLSGGCGCGTSHTQSANQPQANCDRGHCCHHGHSHARHDSEADENPAESPAAPSHDPEDCHICQQLALARIATPTVKLTVVALDVPHVLRLLAPRRPLLVAAATSCRGPPCFSADV